MPTSSGVTVRLQTRFGPTSIHWQAAADRVSGTIDVPQRPRPSAIRLRLRLNGRVTTATVNGQPAEIAASDDTIRLPDGVAHIDFSATVAR